MKYQVRKLVGFTEEDKPIYAPGGSIHDTKQKAEHHAFKLKQIHPKDEFAVLPATK